MTHVLPQWFTTARQVTGGPLLSLLRVFGMSAAHSPNLTVATGARSYVRTRRRGRPITICSLHYTGR